MHNTVATKKTASKIVIHDGDDDGGGAGVLSDQGGVCRVSTARGHLQHVLLRQVLPDRTGRTGCSWLHIHQRRRLETRSATTRSDDDRLHRSSVTLRPRLHDTAGCQTGWTTGCIVYTNIQPVVQPLARPVWQPVASCKLGLIITNFLTQQVMQNALFHSQCNT